MFEDPRLPQCICIPIFEDRNVEGNELFSVELQSLQNFVSSNVSTAVVTVTDNDGTLCEVCVLAPCKSLLIPMASFPGSTSLPNSFCTVCY